MAVTKRTRFEVLRRDDFTCRYCGLKAGETELTVDHVVPSALGGGDDPSNLVAACKDCNAGKSSSSPDAAQVAQVLDDAMRWSAAMQVAAGKMRNDRQADWDYAAALDAEWSTWTYGYHELPIPRPNNWRDSLAAFRAAGLPADLMVDAARIALGNERLNADSAWKYFCGVAWKRIAQLQEAARASLVPEDDDEADADCPGHPNCECEAIAHQEGWSFALRRPDTDLARLMLRRLSQVVDGQQSWNRTRVDV